jgi:hypothetical protein
LGAGEHDHILRPDGDTHARRLPPSDGRAHGGSPDDAGVRVRPRSERSPRRWAAGVEIRLAHGEDDDLLAGAKRRNRCGERAFAADSSVRRENFMARG